MPFDELKKKFPEEGHLCKKLCGKCCTNMAPVEIGEANVIGEWLIKNKNMGELTAQFHHFDDHPNQCPFLQPDKGCFVYPVRPAVCFMFGHMADVPTMPKRWSQKCPEGVAFTEVPFAEFAEEGMTYMILADKASIKTIDFRTMQVFAEDEGDAEGKMIPVKPGSVMERMRSAKNCFGCNVEIPKGGTLFLTGAELLCTACYEKKPAG